MGISSDGILVFGIDFDENSDQLPWHKYDDETGEQKFDGDIDKWWLSINEFNLSYDDENYYDKIDDFLKNNPTPFEQVMHCSYECPMYILAIKNYSYSANRGYPTEIELSKLQVSEVDINDFKLACEKYGIEYSEPKWLLCSIYG